MRHNLLFWIGVLNDEITGVARKQCDFDLAPAPLFDFDHFADVSKMVLNAMSAIETRQFGLLDYGLVL